MVQGGHRTGVGYSSIYRVQRPAAAVVEGEHRSGAYGCSRIPRSRSRSLARAAMVPCSMHARLGACVYLNYGWMGYETKLRQDKTYVSYLESSCTPCHSHIPLPPSSSIKAPSSPSHQHPPPSPPASPPPPLPSSPPPSPPALPPQSTTSTPSPHL